MASDEYKYKCPCSKSYKQQKNLNRHQKECETYQSTLNISANHSDVGIIASSATNNTINNNSNPVVNINLIGLETIDQLTEKVIESVMRSGKLNI